MSIRLWPSYSEMAREAVTERLERGHNLGAQQSDADVLLFEELATDVLGPSGATALSYSSGTSALFAAYASLGLAGTEVLVPSHTFRATVTPLLALGARLTFYDIDPTTGLVEWNSLPEEFLARAKAIVVTHMHGIVQDRQALAQVARTYDLLVVEDCSHAHGARDETGRPGELSDVAVYSVGTTKLVTGGLGGMAFFKDVSTHNAALALGHQKWRLREHLGDDDIRVALGGGYHHRMNPLAAILAADHVRHLSRNLDVKQRCVDQVRAVFESEASWAAPVKPSTPGLHQGLYKVVFRLRSAIDPETIVAILRRHGVRARPLGRPLHHHYPFDGRWSLPGTDEYYRRCIELDGLDLHDEDNLPEVAGRLTSALRAVSGL